MQSKVDYSGFVVHVDQNSAEIMNYVKDILTADQMKEPELVEKAKKMVLSEQKLDLIKLIRSQMVKDDKQAIIDFINYNLSQGRVQCMPKKFAVKNKFAYERGTLHVPIKDGKPHRHLSYVTVNGEKYNHPQLYYLDSLSDNEILDEPIDIKTGNAIFYDECVILPDPIKVYLNKVIDF